MHDEYILFCTQSNLQTSFINLLKYKAPMSEDIMGGVDNLQTLPIPGPLTPWNWCILLLLCPSLDVNHECPHWHCLWLCCSCFRKYPALASDSLKNCRSLQNTVLWLAIMHFQGAVWAEFLQWRSSDWHRILWTLTQVWKLLISPSHSQASSLLSGWVSHWT